MPVFQFMAVFCKNVQARRVTMLWHGDMREGPIKEVLISFKIVK